MTVLYPKISIVTVCFNSAKTVRATLASVADQTWPNIEHIVVDGASQDETVSIIEEYRAGLAAVVSEPDNGIYDAMNKGLRLATGDYVAFLNSDDIYLDETVVERIAQRLASEGLDAIFGDVVFVRAEAPDTVVRRYSSSGFSPRSLALGRMMAHPTLFLRRTCFEKSGPFDSSFRIAGDFELVTRVFKDGSLSYCYVPEAFVRMNLGGASTSGLRALFKINGEILRACRQNGIATSWPRLMGRYPSKLMEFVRRGSRSDTEAGDL